MISDILIDNNLYKVTTSLTKYYNFDMQNYSELVEENYELAEENKAVEEIREKVFGKFK